MLGRSNEIKKGTLPKAVNKIPYTLYYGTFIDTPVLGELHINFNTLVGVNTDGEIDFVHKDFDSLSVDPVEFFKIQQKGQTKCPKDSFKYIDFSKDFTKFFLPGFIDTHIHASQYPNVGIGLDCPLLDWLETFTFPLEKQFGTHDNKLAFAADIYSKVINKTLQNGTTCASYFTAIDPETTKLFADLLLTYGQRGFVGKVCMDHNVQYPEYEESLDDSVNSMKAIIEHVTKVNPIGEMLVKPIITPRFAPVCSRELLNYLSKISSEHDLPIQTHISENLKEIELVKILFPDCENYAQVYNKHKLLNNSTILAHAVHLNDEECSLLKAKNCSISHCPTSNSFISSGEAPIKKYLYKDGINVSLGTDLSGGFESSILGVIKNSILVSHHLSMKTKRDDKISMRDAIFMATQGGAEAVGLSDVVGSFEQGKRFDVQLIDLSSAGSNIDVFEWQVPLESESLGSRQSKMENLLGKWIFSGDDRNCSMVWCNGRLVVDKSSEEMEHWVLVNLA